jgi:3-hydroxyacyl-[acyl-carrier-protein] dehydratase
MSEIININEIMKMIPHRYPLLLVDRIIEYKIGKSIVGIKNVTLNEPQFMGHFPDRPVMPGVLIIESAAQVAAILVAKSMDSVENKDVYFMAIDDTKFRKIVEPGDTMYIYAEIEQHRQYVWKFKARIEVDKEVVAESRFTAMVRNRG